MVLFSHDTGVEILHKKRNHESEILKRGEQIDGNPLQAILRNSNTLFVRTEYPYFIYQFELGDEPAKLIKKVD